jgi:pimeloyl-ACP methyl ester carboxylesterase
MPVSERNELAAETTLEDLRRRVLAGLPVAERRATLAGIDTSILVGGDGPPVVLLHGPAANSVHWMGAIPDLATTHRVVAPDLPGHGASDAGDSALDVESILAWLGALIAEFCAVPPVLVGQLLGGSIAARYAAVRGEELRGLVLVDTFGLRPLELPPEFGAALVHYLAEPDPASHAALWSHCAHDLDALRARMGARWRAFEEYNVDRARSAGLQRALPALMERAGIPAIPGRDLERIRVPTTLIWGRHDASNPLRVAEAVSARHGWPLLVVEDAADDPPVEQPESFVRALRGALSSLEDSTDRRSR